MKKIIYRLLLISITIMSVNSLIHAQYQLPNNGFENFEAGFNGVGQQPTGWKGSNIHMTSPANVSTVLVSLDNNGRSGKCVYLHNEESGAMGINKPAPAYVSLGTPWNHVDGLSSNNAIGGNMGGLSFTHRPDTLSVWIKRTLTSIEKARITVFFWSGSSFGTAYKNRGGSCQSAGANRTDEEIDIRNRNTCTTAQQANYIGNGEWSSTQQYNYWEQIKVPITYFNNSIPEKVNVIISAGNSPLPNEDTQNTIKAGSKLWADDVKFIYSSKIHELRINNRTLNNFNPNTLNYTVTLGQGVNTIPSITAFRSGRELGANSGNSSEITITQGTVDGTPTTITVTAEDGSSTTTYTINFVSQQSTNSHPSDILINGESIANFNGYITSYNFALPYGTTTCPEITVIKAEDVQSYTVNCNQIPGTANITVFAQDNNYSTVYNINFTVAPLSDNTLQDILINGVSIPNFSPSVNSYNINLPIGTISAPTVTPVSAYAEGMQTIITNDNGLNGGVTIAVSAPGSTYTRTYRITYTISSSSNSKLTDIQIGGISIEEFDANTFIYNYTLPRHTTILPTITWTKGDATQTVTLSTNGVEGESKIVVTAQDGSISIYKIIFSVEKSTNSLLSNIMVGGESINGFDPEITTYDILLPIGTTTIPNITFEKGDEAQDVRLINGTLTTPTTIRVSAEDRTYITTYTLNFSVEMSADATLQNILIDGVAIPNFSPTTFNYTYIVPQSITECPNLEITKASAGQTVYIIKPAITGIASIKVLPETGGTGNIYTINFTYQQSNNNLLTDIKVNNVSINDFSPNILNYVVDLSSNDTPDIEYTKGDIRSNVVWVNNGIEGSILIVTAEDGSQQSYSIKYNLPLNTETGLNDILLSRGTEFTSIENFSADTYFYSVELPWGTKNIPTIHPVAKNNKQKIEIFYQNINDTTKIQVTAQNGDTQTYKILFNVERSNVTTLSSIMLNENEIEGFSPDTHNYSVLMPYGTTTSPKVSVIKGITNGDTIYSQKINILSKDFNDTIQIEVIAEDGTTGIYTIDYKVDMNNIQGGNVLQNILINGEPVIGFNGEILSYDITLPYGYNGSPNISVIKNYPEQSVIIDYSDINGTANILVKSNVEGVADINYHINIQSSDLPLVKIDDIYIDGSPLNGFSPQKFNYIIPVANAPTVTYNFDSNKFVVTEEGNHKYKSLRVEDINNDENYNIYTLYYFYTNDVIPNPSFENWSSTAFNNASKPTGWFAPADDRVIEDCKFNFFVSAYVAGNEVLEESNNKTDGNKSIMLKTLYNSDGTWHMPGLITLGEFRSFGSCITSSYGSSINGGIDFRNTPDSVYLDYKLTRVQGGDNMSFDFQLWNEGDNYSDSEKVVTLQHTDNQISTTWVNLKKPIIYDNNNRFPKRLNITINASRSANIYEIFEVSSIDWNYMYADNLHVTYSSALSSISINGEGIEGFDPNITEYNITLPENYTSIPKIEVVGEVDDQEHDIIIGDETNHNRVVSIISKAEDGSQKTYTININRVINSTKTLQNILINNENLTGFDPDIFEYEYILSGNELFMPDIAVAKNNKYQTVNYQISNNTILIEVTAENGENNTYTINFRQHNENNALLDNIEVEGYALSFDANTQNYDIALDSNSKQIPNIYCIKNNENQDVEIKYNNIGDTTLINVLSADNLESNSYKILFTKNQISTSKKLSKITSDGIVLDNFNSNTYIYNIDYNNTKPKLDFERDFYQDFSIVQTFDNETVEIEIENQHTYRIVFHPAVSSNTLLNNILIEGVPINGFSSQTFDYNYDYSGNNLPDVEIVPADNRQTISKGLSAAGNVINIDIKAEDATSINQYSITFNQNGNLSNNSLLNGIYIDGVAISNFDPETNSYSIELSEGTVQVPEISVTKGDDKQTVDISSNGLNGTTTIMVTAQDGSTNSYELNIIVPLSNNALLNAILINGMYINGFSTETFNYTYTLPYGTNTLPLVEWEKAEAEQTVTTSNQGVNGDFTISVTSPSGNVTNNYVITFDVELSNNSLLGGITINGNNLTGFYPEILEYKVKLPYGTTEVPAIEYIKGDSSQVISKSDAASLNDTTIINVVAENGIDISIYKISFEILLSDNAYLQDIMLNGEPLRVNATNHKSNIDFNRNEYWYDISLSYGTTQSPVITYTGEVEDYHSITLSQNGSLADTINAVITVVSQNQQNSNEYFLTIYNEKSNYSRLNDILINGVSLDNFHSDTLLYNIVYPVHSDSSVLISTDDITYVLGEEHQSVTVIQGNNNTIIITVIAHDGESTTTYVITQEIMLSDNALLADILIDGESLQGFEPQIFNYTYTLPFGTSQIPEIGYVKSEEGQTVNLTPGFVEEKSYLYVTAEDGITEREYTIFFEVSKENPGERPTPADVCFRNLGNKSWKATTSKNNVEILIFDPQGMLIYRHDVPLSNPNDELCESSIYQEIRLEKEGVYVYSFVFNKTKRIESGKFINY